MKTNKKILILLTGASSGIGYNLAKIFIKNNYPIILIGNNNYNNLIKLQNKYISINKNIYCFKCDLENYNNINKLYLEIQKIKKIPEIIINSAGISLRKLIQDTTIKDYFKVINTNLTAPFYICKKFIPSLIHNKRGLIVNISSIFGKIGASMESIYSASKFALEGLTNSLKLELSPSNIHVMGIRLGFINTKINNIYTKNDIKEIKKLLINNEIGDPQKTAEYIYNLIVEKKYLSNTFYDVPYGWFK